MVTKKASAPAGLAEAKERAKSGRVTAPKPRAEDVLGAPTAASEWKQRSGSEGILVRVPSGLVARIKTPGIEAFISQGAIPNALMPLIRDAMKRGGQPSEDELAEMLNDQGKIQEIVNLANSVSVHCFIEPRVWPMPAKDEEGNELVERDPDKLYVDEIEFNDRMFVFSAAVGGTSDVEKFREQQAAVMGALPVS